MYKVHFTVNSPKNNFFCHLCFCLVLNLGSKRSVVNAFCRIRVHIPSAHLVPTQCTQLNDLVARGGPAVRHVWPEQRGGDCARDAGIPGDCRLQHQRGDGEQRNCDIRSSGIPGDCRPNHVEMKSLSIFFCGWQVLKVAILAEKYATDYKWYVDVILNLIRLAGDYVSEEVQTYS